MIKLPTAKKIAPAPKKVPAKPSLPPPSSNAVLTLQRTASAQGHTIGTLILALEGKNIFTCHTLELPWRANIFRISCIPPGVYSVRKRTSLRFGPHLALVHVPGRGGILIHAGNTVQDSKGCILVGAAWAMQKETAAPYLLQSAATLARLLALLPARCVLHVLAAPVA